MAGLFYNAPLTALSSSVRIATGLIAFSFLYILLSCVYSVTFHHLAKFPGPAFAKITDWLTVVRAYRGKRHLHILREHQVYGNIVRTGPNSLSFNTVTALRAIYNRKANTVLADWYETIDLDAGDYSLVGEPDEVKHAFRRRIMQHGFSEKATRAIEEFIVARAQTLVEQLAALEAGVDGWSSQTNMSDWATWFAFDVTGEMAFGESMHCLEDPRRRWIPQVLIGTNQWIYYLGFLPFQKLIKPYLGTRWVEPIGGSLAREGSRFVELSIELFEKRDALERLTQKDEANVRKDTFHFLFRGIDPETGKGLTREQLIADSALLIAAGGDAMGITLSAALFYILSYPEVSRKLVREIRTAVETNGGQTLTALKLTTLPYLDACVTETLRMSPPVASVLARKVSPAGMEIDGEYIAGGTTVGCAAYALHHNEDYYPDSFTYRPERWLVDPSNGVTEASVALAKEAYSPFSTGHRNCVGKNVAYLAVKHALAAILWRFDVRPAKDAKHGRFGFASKLAVPVTGGGAADLEWGRQRKGEYQMVDWFISYRDGPAVELRDRFPG